MSTSYVNSVTVASVTCVLRITSNFGCTPCRKRLFSAVHLFVHLNLSISLLLGYLTFMVGIETATSNTVSQEKNIYVHTFFSDTFFLLHLWLLVPAMGTHDSPIRLSFCEVLHGVHVYAMCIGWMCICGSPTAVPVPSSLLLDALWGCHAIPHVGCCFQQALKEVVVLPFTGMGYVHKK